VGTVRDESGAIRMRATVPTEEKAIVGLVRGIGPRLHVAFEEGTHVQWLHDLLQPHAERVVVCNVRGRSETSNKSDRIDADWLSGQLRLNALKPVHHGSTGTVTPRVVFTLSVRCMCSCAPFCSGWPGTMRSMLMPSRIHHSDSLESLARPGDPKGLPLSDRMARGRPYSPKMRSNARRVCGPSFEGYASQASR
jgi:hypothetical protein